ncbi:hypothetical protein SPOG_04041 [Schizosaccharomyces cryophilus OY26]|uniref:Uncharacterized protein n=1 Tax=Schizosaccharomyces cryophilus (strain OY26 / ATCC MYA-4695 / CBS 11777 / NBRC 106824 / NRRL Y48691) TaxID=653667 RepID=S9W6H5_SCHCR|nr:uncharacterized protein SPOG_04041 [Schizosaccharomyces cryophilus OY26]EPY54149.1 hypothetical protein SPOG_04041 [Schizosaccharomyces cryophilus OY26]
MGKKPIDSKMDSNVCVYRVKYNLELERLKKAARTGSWVRDTIHINFYHTLVERGFTEILHN